LIDDEKATRLVKQVMEAGEGHRGYTATKYAMRLIKGREEAKKKLEK